MTDIMTPSMLPDCKVTSQGAPRQSQPLTMRNVKCVLDFMNVSVRFDMMIGGVSFIAEGEPVAPEYAGFVIETLSDHLVKLDINNLSRLDSILTELAMLDKFHPMEDWVKGAVWDGVDRIDALAATITTDNVLWPTYLENWLVQVMEGVCGWRRTAAFSLPYVLVLVGGQGVGKTRWLGTLGAGWMKTEAELHLASPSGKDHQLGVLRQPMAELAELDGVFRKSDISHMKAFISREEDEIRAPYARRAVVRPRMTTFCGSVNDAEFLNDATGSRRFWPVWVTAIAWGFEMDWAQLWAQAYSYWADKEKLGFDLTADEDAQRAGIAIESHTMITAEAEKIAAYYRAHKGNKHFPERAMNRTEILEMLYGKHRSFSAKQTADAGRVLVDIISKHRTIGAVQRAWMFPFNEFGADSDTWPTPSLINIVKDQ